MGPWRANVLSNDADNNNNAYRHVLDYLTHMLTCVNVCENGSASTGINDSSFSVRFLWKDQVLDGEATWGDMHFVKKPHALRSGQGALIDSKWRIFSWLGMSWTETRGCITILAHNDRLAMILNHIESIYT